MLDEISGSCLPCGLHQPQRNRYFEGKLLLEADFIGEQDYHRGHRQLHNSLLHGTGTVCGLKVIQHPSPGCRREFMVVEPGMALDCCGQEIIVPARTLVRVRETLDDDPGLAERLDGTRHLYVGIRRCDTGAEPVPAILPGCEGEEGAARFGRIAEGFEVVLSARAPSEVTPVEVPTRPKLVWEHTLVLGGQLPRGVHLNDAEGLVQVAADADAGGAHLHVYDDGTHDLVSLLEGPARITDTASSREARLLLAAGESFGEGEAATNGVALWRAAEITTDARPAGVLPLDGDAARIAVSPLSGSLFVLDLVAPERAVLASYSAEALEAWLADGAPAETPPEPIQRLELDHGFGAGDDPALRGAAMLRFSHDGRFLALAAPAAEGAHRCYLIDVSVFNAGGMTQEGARIDGIEEDADVVALAWSLDDAFLYLLTREAVETEHAVVLRYALTGDGNQVERRGRGVSLTGTPRDLAVAPTETGAYVLLAGGDGVSRCTTVDMERVKAVTGEEPEQLELSADAVRIDGDGRSMSLAVNGGRLYVTAADAEAEGLPDRGLVAVIDVIEDDCSVHIDRLVDGCTACESEGEHTVILGHLPFYVAGETPRMMDAAEAGDDDVAIDNLTYRQIVPSAATLREVIECMLARGIAEGPPGPRGDPGLDGADGRSITDVQVDLGPPGSDPAGTVTPNDTGLTLELDLPAAAPGEDGVGIDDARIEYVDGLEEPVVAIVEEDGRRILDIDLPRPEEGEAPARVNPIVGLSWRHGEPYPAQIGNIVEELRERGIAVAFEEPVPWSSFTGSREAGPTMLVELQRRMEFESQTFLWATIAPLQVAPIAEPTIEDGLLTDWERLDEARESPGFVLFAEDLDTSFEPDETLRLVLYCDFLVDRDDRPVSGAHIDGKLPTGRGGPGGTFRSWFTVDEG